MNIKIKFNASNRPNLQMAEGGEFYVKCQNCRKIEKIHVNDIKAASNIAILLTGVVVVGIIVTIILWMHFGTVGTVSALIPFLFWQ